MKWFLSLEMQMKCVWWRCSSLLPNGYWRVLQIFVNLFQYSRLPMYVCSLNSPLNVLSYLTGSLINYWVKFFDVYSFYVHMSHDFNLKNYLLILCIRKLRKALPKVTEVEISELGSDLGSVWFFPLYGVASICHVLLIHICASSLLFCVSPGGLKGLGLTLRSNYFWRRWRGRVRLGSGHYSSCNTLVDGGWIQVVGSDTPWRRAWVWV